MLRNGTVISVYTKHSVFAPQPFAWQFTPTWTWYDSGCSRSASYTEICRWYSGYWFFSAVLSVAAWLHLGWRCFPPCTLTGNVEAEPKTTEARAKWHAAKKWHWLSVQNALFFLCLFFFLQIHIFDRVSVTLVPVEWFSANLDLQLRLWPHFRPACWSRYTVH